MAGGDLQHAICVGSPTGICPSRGRYGLRDCVGNPTWRRLWKGSVRHPAGAHDNSVL